MTLTDWASFLFGDVDAIRRIASCPNGLFIGGLLVLSAALARTWQRHDLRMKPWLLGVPFVASFAACVMLVASLIVWRPGPVGDALRNLPALLVLFWMTAPLAWLYGIPFERMLAEASAVKWRLRMLLLVSVWRMALMMQVASVLYNIPGLSASLLLLSFGNLVALIALNVDRPRRVANPPAIIGVMGGISPQGRRTSQTLRNVSGCLVPLFWTTLGPLLLATAMSDRGNRSSDVVSVVSSEMPPPMASSSVWWFAAGSVVFWSLLLPRAQRRQRLNTTVVSMLEEQKYASLVWLLHEHRLSDLPDGWGFPLDNVFLGEDPSRLFGIVEAAWKLPEDSWVRKIIAKEFLQYLEEPILYWFMDERVSRVVEFLKDMRTPFSSSASQTLKSLDEMQELIDAWNEPAKSDSSDLQSEDFRLKQEASNVFTNWPEMTDVRKQFLVQLRKAAGHETPPKHD